MHLPSFVRETADVLREIVFARSLRTAALFLLP